MRRDDALPVLVDGSSATVTSLERLHLTERSLDEGWLQGLLFDNPGILPVEEIEPAYAPLIAIGREVSTSVGRIDALYVAPSGLLTIVETKLWSNPQSRREVVAQIIDYAKELSLWSYEDLDNRAVSVHGRSLWELVQAVPNVDALPTEAAFVDEVTKNLKRGRFLLLVAGDGIREDVERMTAFLQRTPHLHFSLGLIELKVYELPGRHELLVIPSIVARTQEVVRAVVRVEGPGIGHTAVTVSAEEIRDSSTSKPKSTLNEVDFLERFESDPRNTNRTLACIEEILSMCREEPALHIRWNVRTFAILANVGTRKSSLPSLLSVGESGIVKFHHGSFLKNIRERGVATERAEEIYRRYLSGLVELFSESVIQDVLNFNTGPHLNDIDADPEPLKALILNAVKAVEEELEQARP